MKWPYMVVLAVAVSGMIIIGASKIMRTSGNSELIATDTNHFETSPAKLKKLIGDHRISHKKIKIIFASLIKELKPHIEDSDTKELQKLTNDLLNRYGDEINKAEGALKANNIFLVNNIIAKAAKELESIAIIRETLRKLKHQIIPKQKNNTIKTASIPKKLLGDIFFEILRQ